VGRDLHEGVAANGEGLADGGEERERCGFGGEGTVLDDDCADGCCCGECFEAFAGYGIEDDADAFTAGDLLNTCDEIFLVGDDDMVGS
jgi:hypothetical protein